MAEETTEPVKAQTPTGGKTSNKSAATTIIIVVVAVLVVLGVGGYFLQKMIFQKTGEKIAESILEGATGGNVDVNSNGEGISVSNEDGTLDIGKNASWPSDLPSTVAEFKGGDVEMAGKYDNTWTISLTNASSQEVDAYIEDLKASGWDQNEANFDSGSYSMTQLSNGTHNISIIDNGDGTVSITVAAIE
ncbi:MAG: hypothetical protein BWY43_00786 [candidate division WS2 bacterium ADurb.Bin280]|uniref:Uncharacterized protein n=1 Tax=candidate division WS2 bacterium ADurb.Bin280 TaxID=1852829 RepID=A0A1V5SBG8_9BACT|nr:MAG: hypothetical protein BWY43_00786 [candidate division WS2 bacterium ADurb.Bin280]